MLEGKRVNAKKNRKKRRSNDRMQQKTDGQPGRSACRPDTTLHYLHYFTKALPSLPFPSLRVLKASSIFYNTMLDVTSTSGRLFFVNGRVFFVFSCIQSCESRFRTYRMIDGWVCAVCTGYRTVPAKRVRFIDTPKTCHVTWPTAATFVQPGVCCATSAGQSKIS